LPKDVGAPLANRFHSNLARENTVGLNAGFLKLEMTSRMINRRGWPLIMHRNKWFQKVASKRVAAIISRMNVEKPPAVFAFSYAARQIFETAKKLGCPTILGQIDPGPFEVRLVEELHQRHGLEPVEAPPQSYWDEWKVECDLADCIVVNSSWSLRALVKEGIPENKITIVPLAYQIPKDVIVTPAETPKQFSAVRPLQILYLGQMIARKGVIELIDAIDKLEDRDIHWTMVGGGDANLLNQLKQRDKVTVTGHVDRESAIKHYQKADVFVLPTHSDGFAITLLEAAAFGLPIVASPFCGDVVRNGVDGITISEVSGNAIACNIKSLLDSPETLNQFRANQLDRKFRTIAELSEDLFDINERI
jgi:glycosyltransferase involved in cell wall biosynthesis